MRAHEVNIDRRSGGQWRKHQVMHRRAETDRDRFVEDVQLNRPGFSGGLVLAEAGTALRRFASTSDKGFADCSQAAPADRRLGRVKPRAGLTLQQATARPTSHNAPHQRH